MRILPFRTQTRIERFVRAWRYAAGTMNEGDALDLIRDAQPVAGCFALESLDIDRLHEEAVERWGEVPGLHRLAGEAAQRVASKWSSSGDLAAAAREWALDLIADYARSEGITLVEVED